MIHIETTTIGKYNSLDEANRIISNLAEQNYPIDDIYVHRVDVNSKHNISNTELTAAIGGTLGLGLGLLAVSSFSPSPLTVFGFILLAIFAGSVIYHRMMNSTAQQADTSKSYYLLKAKTIEDAKMVQVLLGGPGALA